MALIPALGREGNDLRPARGVVVRTAMGGDFFPNGEGVGNDALGRKKPQPFWRGIDHVLNFGPRRPIVAARG